MDQDKVYRAIISRGRAYVQKKKYVALHLFSTSADELMDYAEQVGGNVYDHKGGFLLIIGNRDSLLEICERIQRMPMSLEACRRLSALLTYAEASRVEAVAA
jgi:hypothetical protein